MRPDDVAGLVLVNPALLTQRLDAKLLPLIARITGSWAPIASDIKKPGIIELAYPKLPTRAMMQLRQLWAATRADLARVTAPVIVFHSAEDHVVEPVNSAGAARRRSPAPTPPRSCCEDSYHVATLDNDAPAIFAGSADWIRAHVPRGTAGRQPRGGDAVTARRGRRDNGLDATLWSPLRDVDPRVGEHLLDLLHAVGIAAYLEPSADVGPYTRTVVPAQPAAGPAVRRPRPPRRRPAPSSTQHVRRERADRRPARSAERGRRPSRRPSPGDLDEDAEWARIVSAFEAEHGRTVVDGAAGRRPAADPARDRRSSTARTSTSSPRRPRRCRCRRPPRCTPSCWCALGLLLIGAPGVLRLSSDVGLILGVASHRRRRRDAGLPDAGPVRGRRRRRRRRLSSGVVRRTTVSLACRA